MIDCDKFHETKRERKFYEDKKQKALRYIDHTIEDWHEGIRSGSPSVVFANKLATKLFVIKKMVKDI